MRNVLVVIERDVVGFRPADHILDKVKIHLVSVKVCIVGFAVGIVEPDSLLVGQDAHYVAHNGRLMKTWLAVKKHYIPGSQVTPEDFVLTSAELSH